MFLGGLELDAVQTGVVTEPPPSAFPPGAVPFSNDEMFLADSFWRQPLAPDAPLHTDSERWARNVCEQFDCDWLTPQDDPHVNQRAGAQPGNAWFSHSAGGSPLYVVGPDQPTQKVYLPPTGSAADGLLQSKWDAVPLPTEDLVAGNSSDKTVCVWQPSTETMWEFWVFNPVTGQPWNYQARWGGCMKYTDQNPGVYGNRYLDGVQYEWYVEGHTASSLPVNACAIQPEELDAGYIGHALHLTVGQAATSFLSPARRTDGSGKWWHWTDGQWGQWRSGATEASYPDMVPEGAHLRFPADLDLAPYTGLTRLLVEAIRDFGMIITDITHGGCSIRFRESSTYLAAGLPSPWPSRFTGWPNDYLWAMPLHRLQVLQP
jgi:hypothetical protein